MITLFQDPLITGLLGTLVGSILGHRLTLWRDKRKEYNERAEIIRRHLLLEKKSLSDDCPCRSMVTDSDLLSLQVLLSTAKSNKLFHVHESYKLAWDCAGDYNDDGLYEFEDEGRRNLISQINTYLSHVHLK